MKVVWWVLISNGEYRGFLCLLVVVFVFVLGSFCFCWWVLLLYSLPPLTMMVLFGMCWNSMAARNFDFLLLPSIREGGRGLVLSLVFWV